MDGKRDSCNNINIKINRKGRTLKLIIIEDNYREQKKKKKKQWEVKSCENKNHELKQTWFGVPRLPTNF